MQKFFLRGIHFLIAVSFLVPLIVLPDYFIFPFIVPKILLLRTVTLLMTGAYLAMLVAGAKEYRVRVTPLTIVIGLFFLSNTISTFIGADWYRSLWDNHERMLGLFTIAHYILYYVVVTSTVTSWRQWRIFLSLFLMAGTIVMGIALLQKGDPEFLLNRGAGRVSSTLGNPIYVGGYGLFLFYTGVLLALREKKNWGLRWGAAGAAGLGFLGIFLSGTRGSLLGLLAGLGVFGLCYAIRFRGNTHVRYLTFGFLSIAVVVVGILFLFRQTSFVQGIPAVGSLLNTSVSGGSADTRLMAWGIAIDAWQARPIFGWGPNNYFYAFNEYYNPAFLRYGWGETWFDNAHNILLNTLAVQGLFGFVVYVSIFGTAIFLLWRAERRGQMNVFLASLATSFLVAHLVQNVFVFENPTSYLYFFLFLAFINSQTFSSAEHVSEPVTASSGMAWGIGAAGMVAALLLVYVTNVQPARANVATLAAIRKVYTGSDPVGAYARATSFSSPHIDDIRNDFARAAQEAVPQYAEAKRREEALALFQLAYGEMEKNRRLHPLDIRTHLQQAQLAQVGAGLTGDAEWIRRGEAILEDALDKSPRRQQIHFLLAGMNMALEKMSEAEAHFKQAIADEPTIDEGWWRLAMFYETSGQHELALTTIAEASAKGVVFSEQNLPIVNQIRLGTTTSN